MTENDLHLIKVAAKLLVLETTLQQAFMALAKSSPSAAESLRVWANQAEEESAKVTISGYTAEMSDLISAEYQEALASFVAPFKKVP